MPKTMRQIREKQDKQWERLDSIIARNYIPSGMSNAKWVKLLRIAAAHAGEVPCLDYKLVYGDEVFHSYTEGVEEAIEETWFREPLIYRELEWIEFPVSCAAANINTRNLAALQAALEHVGMFPLQMTETGLRVHGYVRA